LLIDLVAQSNSVPNADSSLSPTLRDPSSKQPTIAQKEPKASSSGIDSYSTHSLIKLIDIVSPLKSVTNACSTSHSAIPSSIPSSVPSSPLSSISSQLDENNESLSNDGISLLYHLINFQEALATQILLQLLQHLLLM
jgi:hypothetical protein